MGFIMRADPYDNPFNMLLISCNKPDCRVNSREYLTRCGDCTSRARKLYDEGFWVTYDRKPPCPAPTGWVGQKGNLNEMDKHWIPFLSPLVFEQIADNNFELSDFEIQERLWNGEGNL